MAKRKFAPEEGDRKPAVTLVIGRHGVQRVDHKPKAMAAAEVRKMVESEARVRDSYNSLSHHLRMHRGCDDEKLAPNHGGIMHGLWLKEQLTRQQLKAWQWFYDDLRCAMGSSNALVASATGGGANGGNQASRQLEKAYPGHSSYWNEQANRVEEVIGKLRGHEKGLLEQLVRDTLRTEGHKDVHAHDLRYLGNILSGYRDDRQKIAAAVSAIQRMLSSLAEIYGIPYFSA